MRRPAKSPLRRANIQLYWSAWDIGLCIWRGVLHIPQTRQADWHILGVYILFFLFACSCFIHVIKSAIASTVQLSQNICQHMILQYINFFMKSWLMQKSKKVSERRMCVVFFEWVIDDGSLLSLHLKVNEDACLLLLFRIDAFFPPFLYQPSSHYAHPTNLPFCQVSPIYSLLYIFKME